MSVKIHPNARSTANCPSCKRSSSTGRVGATDGSKRKQTCQSKYIRSTRKHSPRQGRICPSSWGQAEAHEDSRPPQAAEATSPHEQSRRSHWLAPRHQQQQEQQPHPPPLLTRRQAAKPLPPPPHPPVPANEELAAEDGPDWPHSLPCSPYNEQPAPPSSRELLLAWQREQHWRRSCPSA